MGLEFLFIAAAIVLMILMMPVAIGVGVKILAPDWYQANRKNLFVALVAVEGALILLTLFVLFGLTV